MITMNLSRPQLASLLILLSSAFFLGMNQNAFAINTQAHALGSHIHSSALLQDTTRPEIYEWGLDGSVNSESTFGVWANISDRESEVYNATAFLQQDSGTPISSLMSFNGTFYATTFPAVETNHTYTVWIHSYDTAGNLAISYNLQFDLRIRTNIVVDPDATLPYVVSSSLLVFAIAIGLSYGYDKRHPRDVRDNNMEGQMNNDVEETAG